MAKSVYATSGQILCIDWMTDEPISFETLGLVRQPLGLLVYYIQQYIVNLQDLALQVHCWLVRQSPGLLVYYIQYIVNLQDLAVQVHWLCLNYRCYSLRKGTFVLTATLVVPWVLSCSFRGTNSYINHLCLVLKSWFECVEFCLNK